MFAIHHAHSNKAVTLSGVASPSSSIFLITKISEAVYSLILAYIVWFLRNFDHSCDVADEWSELLLPRLFRCPAVTASCYDFGITVKLESS